MAPVFEKRQSGGYRIAHVRCLACGQDGMGNYGLLYHHFGVERREATEILIGLEKKRNALHKAYLPSSPH